jgi:hypothetical protein
MNPHESASMNAYLHKRFPCGQQSNAVTSLVHIAEPKPTANRANANLVAHGNLRERKLHRLMNRTHAFAPTTH